MKFFRMFGRSVRDAFKSVFRNFSLSLASISCITITLIIVAVSIIASKNVENFTYVIEKDMTIVAFIKNEVTDETVLNDLMDRIEKTDNVESYVFTSKYEVQQQMQAESEIFNSVMSQWTEEDCPLKDTLQIKVEDIDKINTTAETIQNMEEIEVVKYGEGMVEKMVSAFASIEKVAYGVVAALLIVTVFLIINTIKLTIFSRKREISIMRLVGASNVTIKTPFIIEGMVLGLLGSIIPVVVVIFGYTAFYEYCDGYLFSQLIQLVEPNPFIYVASLATVIIGIVVGMIGSASAVGKYLKV